VRRFLIWLLAGLFIVGLTLAVFLPAAWLAPVVEKQTGGRLTLGDAQGSLWRGSAFIGAAPSGSDPVMPLLPGRFAWRLSPLALVGQVDATVENPAALTQTVRIAGTWNQWDISSAAINLPAERLTALGAPLNTIQPSGQMKLTWTPLQLARAGQDVSIAGTATLQMDDMASVLSPIKPLGAYQLIMNWRGQQAALELKTVKGPMLLSGTGSITNGRLRFSGKAEAEAGQEERLANLLNLLGQRRQEGDKQFIALEFK
jgi:general secretion pathway protein N